ncbi:hypothetical protein V1477_004626 [Vespula maculifrons]|uniref:Uncharacterized protein n=1 Tax=Vespula maculifrons TaxID=7453 RepID=A0ABD2CMF8_VESMC
MEKKRLGSRYHPNGSAKLSESSLPEYVDLLFSVDKMIGRTSVFEAAFHSGSDVVAGWLLKYTEKIKIKMLRKSSKDNGKLRGTDLTIFARVERSLTVKTFR